MFQRCFLCTNNNKAARAKYIYDIMYKCYKRCRFAWALLLHRTAQHTNHRAMRMNKHVWVLNNLGDKKTLYRFLLACRCTLWLTLVKHRFYARSAIPINLRFKLATLATGRHTSFFSLLFLKRAVLNDYITIKNNGNHSMRIKKPEIEFRKADSTPLWRVPINTTTAGCYIDRYLVCCCCWLHHHTFSNSAAWHVPIKAYHLEWNTNDERAPYCSQKRVGKKLN